MKKHLTTALIIVLAGGAAGQAQEAAPGGLGGLGRLEGFDAPASHVRAAAVASHTAVAPGGKFHLAVQLSIDEGWVYYSPRPGKIAKPAGVVVDAGGLTAGEVHWVTFTSGSTVRNFVAMLGRERAASIVGRARFASIGPETSAMAERFGLTIAAEAREHTAEGLIEALIEAEVSR